MGSEKTLDAGGKASVLIELEKNSFPVPEGFVVFTEPKLDQEWSGLFSWWRALGSPKLAARSSAQGEDSAENSFAGQFITVLQISTEAELRSAIKKCFKAVNQKNSIEYAQHFAQKPALMRVYVQRMVQSEFSGVYFSKDPRGISTDWLLEVVHGQGEQLVSGQVTPVRFSKDSKNIPIKKAGFEKWKVSYPQEVAEWGAKVEKHLGYSIDMEWAIDAEGHFWVLQARPITTYAGMSQKRMWIEKEWKRLNERCSDEDAWDGQLFAEWTGLPTEMTFDLWKMAFGKGKAFDLALQKVGYLGIQRDSNKKIEILERIFGRCYLNLKKVLPVYFGKSPYVIKLSPRPHMQFSFRKLSFKTLVNFPLGWWCMLRVAWNLQTHRRDFAQKAIEQIDSYEFSKKSSFQIFHEVQALETSELPKKLKSNLDMLTTDVLQATFVLTLLIESTYQGILSLLKKDLGAKKSIEVGQMALGQGLVTVTLKMQQALISAKASPELWQDFGSQFGHRGPGELDLLNPRWIEMPRSPNQIGSNPIVELRANDDGELQSEIKKLGALRRGTLKQEIEQLRFLLESRERIKMQTMKIYAQIRWLVLRIAKNLNISNQDVFWLRFEELEQIVQNEKKWDGLLISERRASVKACLSVDLPQSFSFDKMKRILNGEESPDSDEIIIQGSQLSGGICKGRVHIVNDPESENLSSWNDDTILVAEATDPSWTALFARAKGIVVARGGVLSHCAIVAREMGRPAVGEIQGATHIFKEGEHVWVDGTHGIVRRIL